MAYTQKQAREMCKAMGFTFRATQDGEFRIAPRKGNEDQAYYTTDIQDAVGTAWCEHNRVTVRPAIGWMFV